MLVARSAGLYHLYDKFEAAAAKRWPPASKGKLLGRLFYSFFYRRANSASRASIEHCDLLNLPNSDELVCVREEISFTTPAIVQPYGLTQPRRQALFDAAAPAETRWPRKKIAFIGMGSLRKGAKDWGPIIRRIRASMPDACFLFLGTMIDNQKVWDDLGLGNREIVGLVPQFQPDELPQLLSDCTLAAFPSYVEGFGLAVVEQLAARLPTIAYDAPGPRDILRDRMPELLVAAGDVARFSDAIIEILQGSFERYQELSDRSAQTALEFSWPAIARDTATEYRKRLGDLASHANA